MISACSCPDTVRYTGFLKNSSDWGDADAGTTLNTSPPPSQSWEVIIGVLIWTNSCFWYTKIPFSCQDGDAVITASALQRKTGAILQKQHAEPAAQHFPCFLVLSSDWCFAKTLVNGVSFAEDMSIRDWSTPLSPGNYHFHPLNKSTTCDETYTVTFTENAQFLDLQFLALLFAWTLLKRTDHFYASPCAQPSQRQRGAWIWIYLSICSIIFYLSESSGVKIACIPLTVVPSLRLAKHTCFCFRTDRIQPRTWTLDPSADSSERWDFIVLVGSSDGLFVA